MEKGGCAMNFDTPSFKGIFHNPFTYATVGSEYCNFYK